MFININKNTLSIYNLKLTKNYDLILKKLEEDAPYEKDEYKSCYNPINRGIQTDEKGRLINHKLMFYNPTGKIVSFNDYYSEDLTEYKYIFYDYILSNLYKKLLSLKEGNIDSLDYISKLYIGEITKEKVLYQKYKEDIFNSIIIKQIYTSDIDYLPQLDLLINEISKASGGDLKKEINKNKKLIHKMNLEGIKKGK